MERLELFYCECGVVIHGSEATVHHLAGHYGSMVSVVHALQNLHRSDGHGDMELCEGCGRAWPCATSKIVGMVR